MPSPIRVLLCDDHALFRRGLSMVLESEDGIEVVAEAEDGAEAIAKAEELAPDVVLMDVRMPRVGGIAATQAIAEVAPSARIIMLTVSDEEADLYEAIKAGASGYLLKEVSIEDVAGAIRAVVVGHSLISPSMATKLLLEFTALAKKAQEQSFVPHLTEREKDVLRLATEGRSNKAIADELVIAENTVKNHVSNILDKLHLHTRTEAVLFAERERLLEA